MLLTLSRRALGRATATARPALFVSARSKTSTGLVGLEVEPDAKPVLLGLYAKTLAALESVPKDAEYRKAMEGLAKSRVSVLESTDDLKAIEKQIGGGQVEQLIQQAQDELSLIPKLVAARAFDPYDGSPAEDILSDLKRFASLPPPPTAAARAPLPHSRARWAPSPWIPSPPSHPTRRPTPFRRRGVALQRDDIPMRPSLDYPVETGVDLELPAPPEEKKE